MLKPATMLGLVVQFSHVSVTIQNNRALSNLSFEIRRGERWAIVGPNGSGKTTLLRIINGYLRPSKGQVTVLEGEFGQIDLSELRKKAGFVSSYLDNLVESRDNVLDIVVSGKYGATRLWAVPPFEDVQRAKQLLRELNCQRFEDRSLQNLSQGERQKVLIARALMPNPELLTFDEPCAPLDLGARETFIKSIDKIARDPKQSTLSMIYITHRIDEIPSSFTHALLLKNGKSLNEGKIERVITSENLSLCFGVPVEVKRWRGRLFPIIRE
ncbi:MAG: ATP-binding cassette domain-containing protein [Thaumarchaeota archaeon]|nr:ATP-binding cassette domain-containing protein [Nitrososphaerota archaeon]